jgi:hypothetical protein
VGLPPLASAAGTRCLSIRLLYLGLCARAGFCSLGFAYVALDFSTIVAGFHELILHVMKIAARLGCEFSFLLAVT